MMVIIYHLEDKLQKNPKEWKRMVKALHVLDYLVKNGAPRVIQRLKHGGSDKNSFLSKIRQLQTFSYK